MKTYISAKNILDFKYPCLGRMCSIDDGYIVVLFTSEGCGVVVYTNKPDKFESWKLGYNSDKWLMERFDLFNGTIELRNS